MYKVNINLDKFELKYQTLTRSFSAQQSWRPNPNISKGDLVPVLSYFRSSKQPILSLMTWGIDKYQNNNIVGFARIENLKTRWTTTKLYPCIIPIKGFYFRNKEEKETNYYYFKNKEKDILFIAGLYCVEKNNNHSRSKVLVLTQSTEQNKLLWILQDRMPVFISQKFLDQWLKFKDSYQNFCEFIKQQTVSLSNPIQIGDWISDDSIRDEQCLLQSKQEWEYQLEFSKASSAIDWEKVIENTGF